MRTSHPKKRRPEEGGQCGRPFVIYIHKVRYTFYMKTIISVILAILVLLGIGYFFIQRGGTDVVTYPTPQSNNNNGNTYATPYATPAATSTTSTMVRGVSVQPNSIVKSPLTVTGEARGNWYFEASFPIKILDAAGKVLGQAPAQAQGEWMTTNFVPFKALIAFATSTTDTGTLVIEKDNPSGLPQNAAEVRIPIRFR
jgi:hypothetical protein